jgi:hypothetical protein
VSLRTVRAHFDGQLIRLDEPCDLEPNTQLLVTILQNHRPNEEREEWLLLSNKGLEKAYGEDEVGYSLGLIKEPNPEYERK